MSNKISWEDYEILSKCPRRFSWRRSGVEPDKVYKDLSHLVRRTAIRELVRFWVKDGRPEPQEYVDYNFRSLLGDQSSKVTQEGGKVLWSVNQIFEEWRALLAWSLGQIPEGEDLTSSLPWFTSEMSADPTLLIFKDMTLHAIEFRATRKPKTTMAEETRMYWHGFIIDEVKETNLRVMFGPVVDFDECRLILTQVFPFTQRIDTMELGEYAARHKKRRDKILTRLGTDEPIPTAGECRHCEFRENCDSVYVKKRRVPELEIPKVGNWVVFGGDDGEK